MSYYILMSLEESESIHKDSMSSNNKSIASETAYMAKLQGREDRRRIMDIWQPISLELRSRGQNSPRGKYPMYVTSLFPTANSIVRDDLALDLEKAYGSEVIFLPVDVRNSKHNFFLLWVLNVLDCLDEEKSTLTRYGPNAVNVSVYALKEDAINEDVNFFRLPPQYQSSGDWVSARVKNEIGTKYPQLYFWDRVAREK